MLASTFEQNKENSLNSDKKYKISRKLENLFILFERGHSIKELFQWYDFFYPTYGYILQLQIRPS